MRNGASGGRTSDVRRELLNKKEGKMSDEDIDIWFLYANGYSFREAKETVNNAYKEMSKRK